MKHLGIAILTGVFCSFLRANMPLDMPTDYDWLVGAAVTSTSFLVVWILASEK